MSCQRFFSQPPQHDQSRLCSYTQKKDSYDYQRRQKGCWFWNIFSLLACKVYYNHKCKLFADGTSKTSTNQEFHLWAQQRLKKSIANSESLSKLIHLLNIYFQDCSQYYSAQNYNFLKDILPLLLKTNLSQFYKSSNILKYSSLHLVVSSLNDPLKVFLITLQIVSFYFPQGIHHVPQHPGNSYHRTVLSCLKERKLCIATGMLELLLLDLQLGKSRHFQNQNLGAILNLSATF